MKYPVSSSQSFYYQRQPSVVGVPLRIVKVQCNPSFFEGIKLSPGRPISRIGLEKTVSLDSRDNCEQLQGEPVFFTILKLGLVFIIPCQLDRLHTLRSI